MSEEKEKNTVVEEIEVAGKDLVDQVKKLVEEGNVRRLIIYKSDGDVLMEVPLTATVVVGSAMLVFAPLWAALGAAAAFLAKVKIEVVREKAKNDDEKEKIDID